MLALLFTCINISYCWSRCEVLFPRDKMCERIFNGMCAGEALHYRHGVQVSDGDDEGSCLRVCFGRVK